jgi:hypothetical protein
MRVLFFMRNFSGYFRQFEPALEAMLERGNEVIVARDRRDDMRGDEWADALQARFERFAVTRTPSARSDSWYELKRELRLTSDFLHFRGPEFDPSSELVDRARRRASDLTVGLADRLGSVLARPGRAQRLARAVHALEAATPTSRAVRRQIAEIDPDVVLLTPHLMPGSLQTEYLRAAIDLGLPTVLCIASWDNLSSKQQIRLVPDAVTLWNETQLREAVEIHGLPAERVKVTGAQVYDHWFTWRARDRSEFCAAVGLPTDRPFVLYAAGALFPARRTEAEWAVEWLRALRASGDPRLRGIAVLVRPHPKRFAEWAAVDLEPFGPVSLWPQEGRMPVEREAKQDFYDSIAHSAGVVGLNTSAMIEAGIAGKRVHTVLVPEFANSQHRTLHFRYLTEAGGGLLRTATSLDEHLTQLAESVAAGGDDGEGNRGFLEAFVRPQGLDHPSTPVFVEVVERAAARGRAARPRPSVRALALRTALQPMRAGLRLRGNAKQRRAKRRRAARRSPARPRRAEIP